jgi:hypothetical protein
MARRSMRIRLQVVASIRARLGMMRWREGGGGEENKTVCIMNRQRIFNQHQSSGK